MKSSLWFPPVALCLTIGQSIEMITSTLPIRTAGPAAVWPLDTPSTPSRRQQPRRPATATRLFATKSRRTKDKFSDDLIPLFDEIDTALKSAEAALKDADCKTKLPEMPDEIVINEVQGKVEAALKSAESALEQAERKAVTPKRTPADYMEERKNEFISDVLTDEIDDTLTVAAQALNLESNRSLFLDDDPFFADEGEVIELLSLPGMNPVKLEIYLREKEEEALEIKKRIRKADRKRLQRQLVLSTIAVGSDGFVLGAVAGVGLYQFFPELVGGDKVPQPVPALLLGGIFGCAAIVATTTGSWYSGFLQRFFGKFSFAVVGFAKSQADGFSEAARESVNAAYDIRGKAFNAIVDTASESAGKVGDALLSASDAVDQVTLDGIDALVRRKPLSADNAEDCEISQDQVLATKGWLKQTPFQASEEAEDAQQQSWLLINGAWNEKVLQKVRSKMDINSASRTSAEKSDQPSETETETGSTTVNMFKNNISVLIRRPADLMKGEPSQEQQEREEFVKQQYFPWVNGAWNEVALDKLICQKQESKSASRISEGAASVKILKQDIPELRRKPANATKKSPRPVGSPTIVLKPASENKMWKRSRPMARRILRAAPIGIPTLRKWRVNKDGSIDGTIVGSSLYEDGIKIRTAPLDNGEEATEGVVVKTLSGSKYFLDTAPPERR